MGYAAFSLHTLYLLLDCASLKSLFERLAKLQIKDDCILYISTQRSRVFLWEKLLRRRLLLAPAGTQARCQVAGCRRSAATDRDVGVMVSEWRHSQFTCRVPLWSRRLPTRQPSSGGIRGLDRQWNRQPAYCSKYIVLSATTVNFNQFHRGNCVYHLLCLELFSI